MKTVTMVEGTLEDEVVKTAATPETRLVADDAEPSGNAEVSATDDEGTETSEVELASEDGVLSAVEETLATDREEDETAAIEDATEDEVVDGVELTAIVLDATVSSAAAQAKLIFCVKVPLDFGALKSQTWFTYGQQTLLPTIAISPLTVTSVETFSAPTLVPVLSTNWKLVPAYVPEQLKGTGWQLGRVRLSQETSETLELNAAT
jgi:hypothetical protein